MPKTRYENQYNKIYDARLVQLRQRINVSLETHTTVRVLDSIICLGREQSSTCAVLGTLFIVSDLKPSIFDKLNSQKSKKQQINSLTYFSKDIRYFLEDSSGRIELEFSDKAKIYDDNFLLSTGMCAGVTGRICGSGKFQVDDIYFAEHPTAPFIDPMAGSNTVSGSYNATNGKVCFISGIHLDKSNLNKESLKVMLDFLAHKRVAAILVAGPMFGSSLDFALFNDLIASTETPLYLCPDINDPTSKALPLRPIHHRLLSKPVRALENPGKFSILNHSFLGTTRFIVEDFLKYLPQNIENVQGDVSDYRMHINTEILSTCNASDVVTTANILCAMEQLLKVGHVCPTAPDTVNTESFEGRDPLVIEHRFDYFFVGMCKEFMSRKLSSNTTIFTVPNFSLDKELVILDTDSRTFEVLKFDDTGF